MSLNKKPLSIISNVFFILVFLFCFVLGLLMLRDFYMDVIDGSVQLILIIILIGFIYFMPSIIAFNREHKDRRAVLALNSILGWTAVGWLVSLVWAFTGSNRKKEKIQQELETKNCPHCAERIKIEAVICRFCNREQQT